MPSAGGIGESLKRKLGPLPVWAWVLIVGVALYWYRNRQAQKSSGAGGPDPAAIQAEAQLIQAEGASAAGVWGTPLPLSAGESVYDPNSGSLLGTGNPNAGIDQSIIALLMALAQRQPSGRRHQAGGGRRHHRPKHLIYGHLPQYSHIPKGKGGTGSRRKSHHPSPHSKQPRQRHKHPRHHPVAS